MLKPIRLEDTTSFISSIDEAIDWERMADEELASNKDLSTVPEANRRELATKLVMSRYAADSMQDPAKASGALKIAQGKSPCRFVIGAIPPAELNRIHDECVAGEAQKLAELKWRAFCAGLRSIDGWETQVPKRTVMGIEYVDPDWIARTFVRGHRKVALEVGMVAWAWNQLTEGERKN